MAAERTLLASWDFGGRTALVTGAAGDIGRAVALRLAESGAKLSLVDVAEEPLAATARACVRLAATDRVTTHVANVTDASAIAQAVRETHTTLGPPQLVFNNAGIQGDFFPTDRYPTDVFHEVLDVNVAGVFNVLKAVAANLREAGLGGSVVNTASMALVGPPNMIAYGASKNAVIAMTKTAAKDLAPLGIRVNAVSPGFIGPGRMWDRQAELQSKAGSPYFSDDPATVADEMVRSVPLRRFGSLDEVASVVVFLMSDEASYLTGVNIEIAGGAS